MPWFHSIQSNSDVSKVVPSDKDILVYDIVNLQWTLVNRGAFGATDAVYLGDPLTNGTWRIVRDGNNLSYQRLELGEWQEKGANIP